MVALSNVRFGKTNEDVRTVQRALIARGHQIPDGATGTFGEQTRAAYRAEQLAQGFTGADADGIPGCRSLSALGRHAGFAVDCTDAAPPVRAGRLTLGQVTYHDPNDAFGEAAMRRYADTACHLTGMDPEFGVPALVTISRRESAYNNPRFRVNDTDSNARGPLAADGHRQNCSRGATQCIPTTFAAFHQAGTATTPYDVVADMCATVNYVRDRYHVNQSGSNFTARVQQADPNRPPHGY
ncbi:peptidoglycan hydrolase-like protein with peptidoglycan-binding domain [Streptomyces griseochromogenes]|uniref:Peptidoglycan hydrolase-like protein with peptidoglycan-binding domain n=1 Tax=Streptomyces griseochromogenes TaxID=68214 RepID=A0ABS4M974_9ACTN|nr:peptidoglycan-binding protein [Streptomyces griseochromogenes]MBP2056231.1 peptidoglycan hydrolase-like protein with peptidoglycan-binding domain [Streptomyces griseochromogenes]